MIANLRALLAHARSVPARERTALGERLRADLPSGCVLLETCHRIELYGEEGTLAGLADSARSAGAESIAGADAARHLLRLAVGRDSAVIAEDQLLHQLRTAVQQARERAALAANLDRLFDLSLRAGRRARSWLPSRRRSLADVALDRVIGRHEVPPDPVLLVGAGDMGRRAAQSLSARGARLLVTSHTPERASVLAREVSGRTVAFDPGAAEISEVGGVVVALSGAWPISDPTSAALLGSSAWVVDLSAPPSLPAELARSLGRRLSSIDDLAHDAGPAPSQALLDRLDALVEDTLEEFVDWSARESQRAAARALADKAAAARSAELHALWQRLPALEPEQREEVERMARHLTERLLRDPLERLHQDGDGRQVDAARELFRL